MPPSSSAFIPPHPLSLTPRDEFSHFLSLRFPLHLHLWPSSLSSVCCFSFNLLRLTNMFTSPSFSPPLNILIFHYLSLSSFVRQITTLLCAQSLSSSLPLLLFVFSHQASLCAAVSLVFLPMSPLLSFTSLVCLLIYVYNPWRSHTERKVAFVVYAQVCLLTLPPLPLSPLFPWRLVSSFSFSPLFQSPRAPGKRERVIWWVYVL